MPRYEYRCRTCGDTFEASRPMKEARLPAPCPAGHDDTVKLLSTVALGGSATSARTGPAAGPSGSSGGGCCGGACGCGN